MLWPYKVGVDRGVDFTNGPRKNKKYQNKKAFIIKVNVNFTL